jgi:hypothetical protein
MREGQVSCIKRAPCQDGVEIPVHGAHLLGGWVLPTPSCPIRVRVRVRLGGWVLPTPSCQDRTKGPLGLD